MMRKKVAVIALTMAVSAWVWVAFSGIDCMAQSVDTVDIVFTNGRFTPQTVTVPARKPIVLRVTNKSAQAIEFESFSLNREKVVPPGETVTVKLPPLDPGTYDFYDDFHHDVPEGTLTAR